MIFGMSTFTLFHVVLSLVGIVSGFFAVIGILQGKKVEGWTLTFFVTTTVLTSVTGFGFAFTTLLPSHVFGIISLVLLALALLGRYALHLAGPWRWIYALGIVLSLYLNVFVLVVQLFQKVPSLHALAPTQSEPPFAMVQLIVLIAFIALGVAAVRKFHPAPAPA
jgi:hypothetical protein